MENRKHQLKLCFDKLPSKAKGLSAIACLAVVALVYLGMVGG